MDADAMAARWPFLAGGGEMGTRLRAYDRAATPPWSPDARLEGGNRERSEELLGPSSPASRDQSRAGNSDPVCAPLGTT